MSRQPEQGPQGGEAHVQVNNPQDGRIYRRQFLTRAGLVVTSVAAVGLAYLIGKGSQTTVVSGGDKEGESTGVTGQAGTAENGEKAANVMTLEKPAAWDKAPTIRLVEASSRPSFPRTAAEAAATFGVDGSTRNPKRWEKTPEGGWHLSEAQIGDDTKDALNVNPKGFLMEGYFDTLPGRNPFAWAIIDIDGNIPAQGGTFWNETRGRAKAEKLQREMHTPKWKDAQGKVTDHPAVVISPA